MPLGRLAFFFALGRAAFRFFAFFFVFLRAAGFGFVAIGSPIGLGIGAGVNVRGYKKKLNAVPITAQR